MLASLEIGDLIVAILKIECWQENFWNIENGGQIIV